MDFEPGHKGGVKKAAARPSGSLFQRRECPTVAQCGGHPSGVGILAEQTGSDPALADYHLRVCPERLFLREAPEHQTEHVWRWRGSVTWGLEIPLMGSVG